MSLIILLLSPLFKQLSFAFGISRSTMIFTFILFRLFSCAKNIVTNFPQPIKAICMSFLKDSNFENRYIRLNSLLS